MVLGGLVLSFTPGLPDFDLPPELVLIAFLPPLLYSAAFFTSLRDLRANWQPIGLLAIGLVGVTTVSWPGRSPTTRSTCRGRRRSCSAPSSRRPTRLRPPRSPARLGAPRRIVAIVEGESLVNDATALVLYQVAVVAVVTGAFSLWEGGAELIVNALAGVAIGLAVGFVDPSRS